MNDFEEAILSREWFYRYQLPSGRCTRLYISDEVARIHDTRLEMMMSALEPFIKQHAGDLTAGSL